MGNVGDVELVGVGIVGYWGVRAMHVFSSHALYDLVMILCFKRDHSLLKRERSIMLGLMGLIAGRLIEQYA